MKQKKILQTAVLIITVIFSVLVIFKRSALQPETVIPLQSPQAAASAAEEIPTETELPAFGDKGSVVISEFMAKNKAYLQAEDGCFYDWVELENVSARDVSLKDWRISDKQDGGRSLPDITLKAGEQIVIFASGLDSTDGELHADFSLSEGETLFLIDPAGETEQTAAQIKAQTDTSYTVMTDGTFAECLYPTPGRENTREAYAELENEKVPSGPLIINEAASKNYKFKFDSRDAYPDWIEIKNISSASVDLSEYYISDTDKDFLKLRLPAASLAPGQITLIVCAENEEEAKKFPDRNTLIMSLGSEIETLYLSSSEKIVDFMSMRDLPYSGSMGRMDGENGVFLFEEPTPEAENKKGTRYYAESPVCSIPDGVYENVDSLSVELNGNGKIYYTLDGSLPTRESELYTDPITVSKTTVIRAICSDGIGLDSRAKTMSFIINEGHSLPVLSVVGNDTEELNKIYRAGIKGEELPGCIEFFDGDSGFSIDCGIRMAGRASLGRPKKNLTFKFRGSYGKDSLVYDLFDGGITSFDALTLRSGQDNEYAVIRNEISEDLCLEFTDKVVAQRSRYCVLYLNGEYYGLFALKEKINEAFCADYEGVSKESITIYDAPAIQGEEFFNDVVTPCVNGSVEDDAVYKKVCEKLDMDSFIDWLIMQGYTGNFDITYGNVSYYRSTESDNKWNSIFYDLDAAFRVDYYNFRNIYNIDFYLNQICQMVSGLMKNQTFRDAFLTRAAEALSTTLSDEHVVEKMKAMYALIDDEMVRDCERWNLSYANYQQCRDKMINMITGSDYHGHSIETISLMAGLTEEERLSYFGE